MIENSFENQFRRVPRASRIAPGGLWDSTQHTSVISARFCDAKVPTILELFGIFGLKVAPGLTPKITRKSTFCEKRDAEEGIFVDFCRV